MAAAGADPKRVEELSSISDYCRPLMEFMAALPPEERVVLVGHSLGGVVLRGDSKVLNQVDLRLNEKKLVDEEVRAIEVDKIDEDDGLHDSSKIAAFNFDGCLPKTSVKGVNADTWSVVSPSIPDKLHNRYKDELHDAREDMVNGMKDMSIYSRMGVKRMEELNNKPFHVTIIRKFVEDVYIEYAIVEYSYHVGISLAMEKFPHQVSVAVFVTAFMPGPDFSLLALVAEYEKQLDYVDTKFRFNNGQDKPPTSMQFGLDYMATHLYNLSPPQDLTLATLLMRPIGLYDEADLANEVALTKQNHGSVRRVFMV
ncbi:hypothetical protein SASPL_133484 [Salvia splendens]|uniref:Uncharacterized protein n=1 Tax=Salvia splendens TaxID=180675 RepID=A0A8X8X507_SALSN|nr:hypothetical protein SASPL_133484 [Salvia splendens]